MLSTNRFKADFSKIPHRFCIIEMTRITNYSELPSTMVGWLVGWLVFNGTFSTKRLYCAI